MKFIFSFLILLTISIEAFSSSPRIRSFSEILAFQQMPDGNFKVLCSDLYTEIVSGDDITKNNVCPTKKPIQNALENVSSIIKVGENQFDVLCKDGTYEEAVSASDIMDNKVCKGSTLRPVDILWVVDNSASMLFVQEQLAVNFNKFIQKFQTQNPDFRIAVGTTDAFVARHYNDNNRAKFKTGTNGENTNTPIITNVTPDLIATFQKNIQVGSVGLGDERSLDSMQVLLSNPLNSGFRRPGAFLAVIIVTDEDDFSHGDWWNGVDSYYATTPESASWAFLQDPTKTQPTGITPISSFKTFLDDFTRGLNRSAKYSVSSIAIQDLACKAALDVDGSPGRRVAERVNELVTLTGGQKLSICDQFGDQLSLLAQKIIHQSKK